VYGPRALNAITLLTADLSANGNVIPPPILAAEVHRIAGRIGKISEHSNVIPP